MNVVVMASASPKPIGARRVALAHVLRHALCCSGDSVKLVGNGAVSVPRSSLRRSSALSWRVRSAAAIPSTWQLVDCIDTRECRSWLEWLSLDVDRGPGEVDGELDPRRLADQSADPHLKGVLVHAVGASGRGDELERDEVVIVERYRERALDRFDCGRVLARGVDIGQVDVVRGAVGVEAQKQCHPALDHPPALIGRFQAYEQSAKRHLVHAKLDLRCGIACAEPVTQPLPGRLGRAPRPAHRSASQDSVSWAITCSAHRRCFAFDFRRRSSVARRGFRAEVGSPNSSRTARAR